LLTRNTRIFYKLKKHQYIYDSKVSLSKNYLRYVLKFFKNLDRARCWWLTPVILAICEAEIKRIVV
jgi:hypothetical protein